MKQKIKSVGVRVNGKDIELNDFVETIFGNTILGMVSSLRLNQPPKCIEVCVEVKSTPRRKTKA
jgi:hypothetical protein